MPLTVTLDMALAKRGATPYYGVVTQPVLPSPASQSQVVQLSERAPAADSAPELRSTYHDSYGGSGGFMAPAFKRGKDSKHTELASSVPPSPQLATEMSRLHALEDRLSNQERASQNLLERAMRIKEDVVDNLNLTHSSWQGEKKQRELLQEHIRSITELVKSLDRDIKVLEQQIRQKDSYIANSGSALKSLELQQVTAVTDMRGRIARCDSAIAKLVNDHVTFQDTLRTTSNRQQELAQRQQEKIQALEIKMAETAQKFERNSTESLLKTQSKQGDLAKSTALVETKLKGSIDELRLQMSNQKQLIETEREKAVSRLSLDMERSDVIMKEKLDKLEQRMEHALSDINKQLNDLRARSSTRDLQKSQQELERRVAAMVEGSLRQQTEKFNRLKDECRQGFTSVHDSITNSKRVLEGKLTLSEEQLRKDINHIKNMVVLV